MHTYRTHKIICKLLVANAVSTISYSINLELAMHRHIKYKFHMKKRGGSVSMPTDTMSSLKCTNNTRWLIKILCENGFDWNGAAVFNPDSNYHLRTQTRCTEDLLHQMEISTG